jgi:tetraacyldisaccharide 4'-kinase
MRADFEKMLTDTWYRGRPPSLWLKGLVPLYKTAGCIDKWWKSRQKCEDLESACITVVGNITVGGSGKTPLVIRLCRILSQAGLAPGVISRGYGRGQRGLRLVKPGSQPGEVGDEPILIARQAGVPVIVAADRCAAARALLKQGVDAIIADDGLQHHRLPRSMEICVVDGSRAFGNGRLIPAGPLREPMESLASFDHVVINGDANPLPEGIDGHHMGLVAGLLRSLDDGQGWRLAQFRGCSVNAVAGIGNPERFFKLLQQSGIKVIEHAFPDHHAFSEEDFAEMNGDLPILMTEKDAVKCTDLGLRNAWFLTVDAVMPALWEQHFIQQVMQQLNHPGDTA